MRRVLRSWSLRMRKGRPYSSNARVPTADMAAPLARPEQAGAGYRRTRRAVTQHAHPRAAPRLRSRRPCDTFGGWDLYGASSGPFWKHRAGWELRGAAGGARRVRGLAVREGRCTGYNAGARRGSSGLRRVAGSEEAGADGQLKSAPRVPAKRLPQGCVVPRPAERGGTARLNRYRLRAAEGPWRGRPRRW